MPEDGPSKEAQDYGRGYEYVATGFTFAFAILAFGALGWLVDGWLHTRPLFAIIGSFVGGTAGFLRIYYQVQGEIDAEKREAGGGKREP